MKFIDLYKLLPESQEIHLIFGGHGVLGEADAMGCLLNDDAFNAKVVSIEAHAGKLKVWIEEDD